MERPREQPNARSAVALAALTMGWPALSPSGRTIPLPLSVAW